MAYTVIPKKAIASELIEYLDRCIKDKVEFVYVWANESLFSDEYMDDSYFEGTGDTKYKLETESNFYDFISFINNKKIHYCKFFIDEYTFENNKLINEYFQSYLDDIHYIKLNDFVFYSGLIDICGSIKFKYITIPLEYFNLIRTC